MKTLRVILCCCITLCLACAHAHADEKIHSIVLLLNQPREVNEAKAREALSAAFGVRFAATAQGDNWLLDREAGVSGMPMSIGGESFAMLSSQTPYFSRIKEADLEKLDLRLAKIVRDNKAWIAVDWYPPEAGGDEAAAYQKIGKAVSALIDEDVIGLYTPASKQWVWMHEDVKEILKSDAPRKVFDHPDPQTRKIDADDPRLLAAIKEAQDRWPEFTEAFKTKQATESFAVKMKFTDGEEVEHMWVQVNQIDGKSIVGVLDNKPVLLKNVKYGDKVELKLADVEDWFYTRGGEPHGGFSIKAFTDQE